MALQLKIPAGIAGIPEGNLDVTVTQNKERLITTWLAMGTKDGHYPVGVPHPALDAGDVIAGFGGDAEANRAGLFLVRSIVMNLLDSKSGIVGAPAALVPPASLLQRLCDALNTCAPGGRVTNLRPAPPNPDWIAGGGVAAVQTPAGNDGNYTPATDGAGLHPILNCHNHLLAAGAPLNRVLALPADRQQLEAACEQLIRLIKELANSKKVKPEIATMLRQTLVAVRCKLAEDARSELSVEMARLTAVPLPVNAQLLQDFAAVVEEERQEGEAAFRRQINKGGKVELTVVLPGERLEKMPKLTGMGVAAITARVQALGNPATPGVAATGLFFAQGVLATLRQSAIDADNARLLAMQEFGTTVAVKSTATDTGLQGAALESIDAETTQIVADAKKGITDIDGDEPPWYHFRRVKFEENEKKDPHDPTKVIKSWKAIVTKHASAKDISSLLMDATKMLPKGKRLTLFGDDLDIRKKILLGVRNSLRSGVLVPIDFEPKTPWEEGLKKEIDELESNFGKALAKIGAYTTAVATGAAAAVADGQDVEHAKRAASVKHFHDKPEAVQPVVTARCGVLLDILKISPADVINIAGTPPNLSQRLAFRDKLASVGVVVDPAVIVAAGPPPQPATQYRRDYYEAIHRALEAVGTVASDAWAAKADMRAVFKTINDTVGASPDPAAPAVVLGVGGVGDNAVQAMLKAACVERQAAEARGIAAAAAGGGAITPLQVAQEALAAILAMRATIMTIAGGTPKQQTAIREALNEAEDAARKAVRENGSTKSFEELQKKMTTLKKELLPTGITAAGPLVAWRVAPVHANLQQVDLLANLGRGVDAATQAVLAAVAPLAIGVLQNVSTALDGLSRQVTEVADAERRAVEAADAAKAPGVAADMPEVLAQVGKKGVVIQIAEQVDPDVNRGRLHHLGHGTVSIRLGDEELKQTRVILQVEALAGRVSHQVESRLNDTGAKMSKDLEANAEIARGP